MEEYLATDSLRFVIRVAHRSGSHWIRICEEYRSRKAAAAALKRLRCHYPDAECSRSLPENCLRELSTPATVPRKRYQRGAGVSPEI